jgi:hypothetical protein
MANTSDYSATQAPENRDHIESKQKGIDQPSRVPVEVGMEALHRETVPSMASADEREGTERE